MKLTFWLLLFCMQALAQQRITGHIQTTDGTPLAGASIAIKGTTKGTLADEKGNFSLNVSLQDILTARFVGFKIQELTIQNSTNINFILKPDDKLLQEVVVKSEKYSCFQCRGCCICPVIHLQEIIQLHVYPNPSSTEIYLKPVYHFVGNAQEMQRTCQTSRNEEDDESETEEWLTDDWTDLMKQEKKHQWLSQREQLAQEVFAEAQNVQLVNMMGQVFQPTFQITENKEIKISLNGLLSGIYVVRVMCPRYGGVIAEKIRVAN